MKNQKAHYSLRQEAGSNVHKLYIYDDVTKYGDFDWWTWNYSESETSAQHFRKVLEEIPETDVIEVHINSNGGDVGEGVTIYNLLKQKKCKELVAYVDGFAWSVASVILQAADRRVMGLGTSLLIHNMWTTVSGNADQLRKAADDLDTLMEGNRKIYMERVNITEEELESMMDVETYLTAEQAVEQGFADEVSSKAGEEAGTVMQQLQTQLLQLRTEMLNQKAIKTQMQDFWVNFYNSGSVNGVLEFVHSLTEGFTALEKTLGPIPALLTAVFAAMTVKNATMAGLKFLSGGGLATVVG